MKLLDLFCGAGGCTKGYQMAGFTVRGIDIKRQPRYCGEEFVQAEALEYLTRLIESGEIEEFDVIHASPPCQSYSQLMHLPWLSCKAENYPRLIKPLLDLLNNTEIPWVIENVENSWKEFAKYNVIVLCGQSFKLKVYRHRLFASNFLLLAPPHSKHSEVIGQGRDLNNRECKTFNVSSAKGSWGKSGFITVAGNQFRKADGAQAMGIEWMLKKELAQAIPPAYTEFIGRQLFYQIERLKRAAV